MPKLSMQARKSHSPIQAPFEAALLSARMVLADTDRDSSRKVYEGLREVVKGYEAMSAVRKAHEHDQESGMPQWRAFLRTARVRTAESGTEYRERIAQNLVEMKAFTRHLARP